MHVRARCNHSCVLPWAVTQSCIRLFCVEMRVAIYGAQHNFHGHHCAIVSKLAYVRNRIAVVLIAAKELDHKLFGVLVEE